MANGKRRSEEKTLLRSVFAEETDVALPGSRVRTFRSTDEQWECYIRAAQASGQCFSDWVRERLDACAEAELFGEE